MNPTQSRTIRLGDLPVSARLMLTAFLALIGAGYLVSLVNIFVHHQEADLDPGLSPDDLKRVYHGIEKETTAEVATRLASPMLKMVRPGGKMRKHLERGGEPAVRALMGWLEAGAPERDFATPALVDPGDPSPRAVIAAQCVRCHNAAGDVGDIPYAADADALPEFALVAAKASPLIGPTTQQTQTLFLPPTGTAELIQITHAHILSIPAFTLIIGVLFFLTGLRPAAKAFLGPLPMIALGADFASWWLARTYPLFVYVVAVAGVVFGATLGCQIVCVLSSMWFRGRRACNAS